MKNILDEKLVSVSEAAKLIPSRPHVATVWRWIERGVRGHRLSSVLVGGQRFTTAEKIREFLERLNGQGNLKSPSSKSREKAVSKAIRQLESDGF